MNGISRTALLAAGLGALACQESAPTYQQTAELILSGGRVVTMDTLRPSAEAIAIAGGRIIYVGDDAGVAAFRGPATREFDVGDGTILPGLTDAHAHLMNVGRLATQVDVLGSTTYVELLDAVRAAVATAPPGEWIVGRGWHQEKWTDTPDGTIRGFPTNDDLNAIAPDNPVSIRHASGHGRLVNLRALEAAGVTAATPDPAGGEILHRPDGTPSGMMLESAEDLIEDAYDEHVANTDPAARRAADRAALEAGIDEFLRNGITEIHDAGANEADIALYRAALDAGTLRMRVYAMLSQSAATEESLARLRTIGEGDHHLTVRAIKMYVDGALGSRGALLLEPYADDASSGEEILTRARLREVTRLGLRHGFQVAAHAIGDRANRRILNIYESEFERAPEEAADARFRVEHAQILHPDDVARFAELGVTAAMQGVHSTSDGPWTPTRLGIERSAERAYVFRDLWDAGALIVNGTDAAVERVNPWASIAGMSVGRMADGTVFNPHHLLTREEALATYTINPARAAFEEDLRGTLEVGKLADLTVVAGDPMTVPDEALATMRTLMTVVGGEVVYEAD